MQKQMLLLPSISVTIVYSIFNIIIKIVLNFVDVCVISADYMIKTPVSTVRRQSETSHFRLHTLTTTL